MSQVLPLIIFSIILIVLNKVCYFKSKSKSLICYCVFLTLVLALGIVMRLFEIQFIPSAFSIIIILLTMAEVLILLISRKGKILFGIFIAVTLVACGILGGFGNATVKKQIDNEKYVGVYDSFTGVSETKVYYYRSYNNVFMSAKCYCVENYGIVLTGKPDFNSKPYSVEYCNEAE